MTEDSRLHAYDRLVISLTHVSPSSLPVDALVVLVQKGVDGPIGLGEVPDAITRLIASDADALGLTGAADEVVRVPASGMKARVVALAGIGSTTTTEATRRAVGAAIRVLSGLAKVAVIPPDDETESLAAAAEGALLGAYSFVRYQTAPGSAVAPVEAIQLVLGHRPTRAENAAVERAEVIAQGVHLTRDLVNTAPNDLYPSAFVDEVRTAVKGLKDVKIQVLDEKALASGGYGGLLGVGQGSARPPRLVKLSYTPGRTKRAIALVGKGITFDTGGISLKPPADMDEMKSDMAGAATVLSAVIAAARLEIPIGVTGWLCLAENMPSGTAQRPSDVLTIKGGTTVEVLNTDAEGRLVLADGLVAAVEEEPELVVDVATLTGAQMVALGRRVAAVMGTDDARDDVVAAAQTSGEAFWPMPLPEEMRSGLKSKVADIANIGERWGGMLLAGLFLKEFVGDTPWAHLDIAGPAFNAGSAYGYTPTGGTGSAVRTLVCLLESRAQQS